MPAVAWGYFPVNADGDDLVVWTDDDRTHRAAAGSTSRASRRRRSSASPTSSAASSRATPTTPGSTWSPSAPRRRRRSASCSRRTSTRTTCSCHGLSVEMTEALAELWHKRIREEWGFVAEDGPSLAGLFRQKYRGSRYSWGYPACPDLDDQAKLVELLEVDRIGVKLTEEFQLEPEQSDQRHHRPAPRGEVLRRLDARQHEPDSGDLVQGVARSGSGRPPSR